MAAEDLPRQRRWTAYPAALAFAALVGASGWGLLSLIEARAAGPATETAEPEPLPVRTVRLERQGGYRVEDSFAGFTEPAREARAAFERAGLVTEVLVEDGERVRAGQVLARLDARALEIERDRLEAERDTVDADIALAERTLARRERLRAEGFETGQSYDQARFNLNALEGRRDSIDARLRSVALDLEKSELTAPFAGTVAERMLDEGAVVSPGTGLLTLLETGRPQARIGVAADIARTLSPGDRVALEGGGRPIDGQVVSVSPDVDPATRTVAVLVDLRAEAGVAMGSVVRLRAERALSGKGAWVPLTALTEGTRGLWSLYLLGDTPDGPVAEPAAVEILHTASGRAYVRGVFDDGARAVADGVHRVTAGRRVSPAE